jgi:hypothetical protein
MLLNYEVVPPSEARSILRILTIQVFSLSLTHSILIYSFPSASLAVGRLSQEILKFN